jgi:hypothetical protein
MLYSRVVLLSALLVAVALPARAFQDDKPLKETLKVKDVQGGVAGFTGKQITIQPSGKWAEYPVVRGTTSGTPSRNGKLSKQELAKLAKEVDRYSPETLKSSGKAGKVNPRVITVTSGKHTATLKLKGGEMPKADTESVEGRFAGILAAVEGALPKAKEKGKGKGK